MRPETLREIVCALQSMPGDIACGVFNWTLPIRQLFARIQAGDALDDGDFLALDRACEIAQAISRVLHARGTEARFDDYRSAIAHNLSDDDFYLSGFALEITLRKLLNKRGDAEREYQQAWAQELIRRMNDAEKAT